MFSSQIRKDFIVLHFVSMIDTGTVVTGIKTGYLFIKTGIYSLKQGMYSLKQGMYSLKQGIYSLKQGMYSLISGSLAWLNQHSSTFCSTTDVYKLDAYTGAGSNLTCASVHLGCLVPAD